LNLRMSVEWQVFLQVADIISTFVSKDLEKHTAGPLV